MRWLAHITLPQREALATEGLQDLVRLIFHLTQPVFEKHSDTATELKSPAATRQWHLSAAKMSWLAELKAVADRDRYTRRWRARQTLGTP